MNKAQIERELGISRQTLYQHLREMVEGTSRAFFHGNLIIDKIFSFSNLKPYRKSIRPIRCYWNTYTCRHSLTTYY